MVTDEQVKLLRRKRMMPNSTEQAAAAAADMSQPTARKWRQGTLPSESKGPRTWRTRQDPFEMVWDSDIVPMLEDDRKRKLKSKTILGQLVEKYPGQFDDSMLRTLQRRIRYWRAVNGPEREIFFSQDHPPGREGAFDFTCCNDLEVTINGVMLCHLLFVFRLSFSGWQWIQVAFGETFEAMIDGLQGALRTLGGCPQIVRSDNLSAATHELKKGHGRGLTGRYKDFLDHYGMASTRIKPGKSNENGGVEKGNELAKSAIEQELILRGNRDFPSLEDYEAFAREALEKHINSGRSSKLLVELDQLAPLPNNPLPNYTKYSPTVNSGSLIRVSGRLYSVPSRLINHTVDVYQYANHLEVYYHSKLIERMPRIRGEQRVRIDYRHIIWSLVRKPGAFERYKFREELFPSLVFRKTYDALKTFSGIWEDLEYLRILHLAASTMESQVERSLLHLLETDEPFDYAKVKSLADPQPQTVPHVSIGEPDLASYDELLSIGGAQ